MKVKNDNEAWDKQEIFKSSSHGWIQWKGTTVCVDIHCECSELSHYDGDFMYFIKCPYCGKVYFCNGHIQLIELEEIPDMCVQTAFKTEG